jgi:hypothetical protein
MRFRVIEHKSDIYRPFFYPQYRSGFWSGWRNIADHPDFLRRFFNTHKEYTEDNPYVYTMTKAIEIIENFKKHLECYKSYQTIHTIE